MRRRSRSRSRPSIALSPFGTIQRHFDSVTAYCFDKPAPRPGSEVDVLNRSRLEGHQRTDGVWVNDECFGKNTEWLNASSSDEAAQRVTHGWADAARRVQTLMDGIDINAPMSVRRKRSRSDQGDELDIHRVYRGQLDTAWTSRQRRPVRSPLTIRIVVQTNLLANMTPDEMFWRGAACAKLADLLVEAGYNVEIIGAVATDTMGSRSGEYFVTFPLKDSQEPLDIERLCGVVCNAGFHRLFGFRMYQYLATFPMAVGGARSNTDGSILRKHYGSEREASDGFPSFITPYAITNLASATAWVRECVERLNQPQLVD